jgi:hypothetical protein
MSGMSIQMNLVNQMYGEVMAEVSNMIVILAVNGLLNTYANFSQLAGITTGGSLSFHAPNLPGSTVQGTGIDPNPLGSEVFLIGPNAVNAVKGLFSAFNPSNIDSLADLYSFFDGIISALGAAQDAYDEAHHTPSSVENGCLLDLFDEFSGCRTIVLNEGFADVNDGFIPSPEIVIYHNIGNGMWSSFIANFVAN